MLEFPVVVQIRVIVLDSSFVLGVVKPVGEINEDSRLIADDFVAMSNTGRDLQSPRAKCSNIKSIDPSMASRSFSEIA